MSANYSTDRIKILRVSYPVLLEILVHWRHHEVIQLPTFEGVPKDAVVISAHTSPSQRAFELVITHESFPEVPHESLIPIIHSGAKEIVRFKQNEKWEFFQVDPGAKDRIDDQIQKLGKQIAERIGIPEAMAREPKALSTVEEMAVKARMERESQSGVSGPTFNRNFMSPSDGRMVKGITSDGDRIEAWYDHSIKQWRGKDLHGHPDVVEWTDGLPQEQWNCQSKEEALKILDSMVPNGEPQGPQYIAVYNMPNDWCHQCLTLKQARETISDNTKLIRYEEFPKKS